MKMRLLPQAFLGGELIMPRSERHEHYQGKLIDELNLTVNLYSQKDVDELIKYLQIHKHCFEK